MSHAWLGYCCYAARRPLQQQVARLGCSSFRGQDARAAAAVYPAGPTATRAAAGVWSYCASWCGCSRPCRRRLQLGAALSAAITVMRCVAPCLLLLLLLWVPVALLEGGGCSNGWHGWVSCCSWGGRCKSNGRHAEQRQQLQQQRAQLAPFCYLLNYSSSLTSFLQCCTAAPVVRCGRPLAVGPCEQNCPAAPLCWRLPAVNPKAYCQF